MWENLNLLEGPKKIPTVYTIAPDKSSQKQSVDALAWNSPILKIIAQPIAA